MRAGYITECDISVHDLDAIHSRLFFLQKLVPAGGIAMKSPCKSGKNS